MKKILYISLVDWNWIKQRPQIIAEGLAENYEVEYLYPKYYRNKTLANNVNRSHNLHLYPRLKVPFSGRSRILKKIDSLYSRFVSKKYIKRLNADLIYVTHPDDYSKNIELSDKIVVYDCMDNYSEFTSDKKRKNEINNSEERICKRADLIFVSSVFLLEKIKNYGIDTKKIHLVRNGYSGNILPICHRDRTSKCDFSIAYIGTIGPWFDCNLLVQALEQRSNIVFHIAGPLDKQLPTNHRIIYDGIINHDNLFEYAQKCDALMMPFMLNNIVEAVDPVKLYEYINFNKPIISIHYKEIERFNDFVCFYSNIDSFINAIDEVVTGELKYSCEQRTAFLANNSWKNRIETVSDIIDLELNNES